MMLVGSAAAFEVTDCKAYLSGTWDSAREEEVQANTKVMVKSHSVYKTDGTFTATQSMEPAGQAPVSQSISGTWDAKPGEKPDQCAATITMQDSAPISVVLTVVDENTVRDPNGREAHRDTAAK